MHYCIVSNNLIMYICSVNYINKEYAERWKAHFEK